jgi:dephospho-CoA kinase
MMIVVGITGSTATGKTTAAHAFARRGYPVFSADAEVHRLLRSDSRAVAAVRKAFPSAWNGKSIDRSKLADVVFRDGRSLATLEALLHGHVRRGQRAFLREAAKKGARVAVLDIPLLFETGAERQCDVVLVMTAPRAVQNDRLAARGVSATRARAMRARQLADGEKQRRADYVVDSGMPKPKMLRALGQIIRMIDPSRKAAVRS